MTYQPVIPMGGYTGWRFLQRTLDTQKTAFESSAQIKRETEYFTARIGSVRTASDLVSDRRLLKVALGAFGLGDDINNKFFIEKILSEGTADDKSLANRFADKRYAQMSKAFGFDSAIGPKTQFALFAKDIVSKYVDKEFGQAVGVADPDLRIALNLKNGLDEIAAKGGTDRAQWFSVMGNPPLRKVFDVAFGFPDSFAALDIDKQFEQFQRRAKSTMGTDSLAEIAKPEAREKLIRLYLIRSEAQSFSAGLNSAQVALTLLSRL